MALMNGLFNSTLLAMSETRGLNELLELLKGAPDAIDTLSTNEKTLVILFVAGLGMAITFAVLVFLWFAIAVVSKILQSAEAKKSKPEKLEVIEKAVPTVVEEDEDEELIAVISAAIAASLNTSIHNIVVKNIVRSNDRSPSWAKTGRIEQMNTRF